MRRRFHLLVMALVWAAALTGFALTPGTASATVLGDRLGSGSAMYPGDVLVSPNGQWQLAMQDDGNGVVYGPSGAVWSTGTGAPQSVFVVQNDGNAVVLAPGPRPVWNSGTSGGSAALVMQDDGNLVLYGYSTGEPTWSSRTGILQQIPSDRLGAGGQLGRGQVLLSPSGAFQAGLNTVTGTFQVAGPDGWIWTSGAAGGQSLVMQRDGNLVVYGGGRSPWSSRTAGASGAFVVMQDDGNLVIYQGGRAVWSSYFSR